LSRRRPPAAPAAGSPERQPLQRLLPPGGANKPALARARLTGKNEVAAQQRNRGAGESSSAGGVTLEPRFQSAATKDSSSQLLAGGGGSRWAPGRPNQPKEETRDETCVAAANTGWRAQVLVRDIKFENKWFIVRGPEHASYAEAQLDLEVMVEADNKCGSKACQRVARFLYRRGTQAREVALDEVLGEPPPGETKMALCDAPAAADADDGREERRSRSASRAASRSASPLPRRSSRRRSRSRSGSRSAPLPLDDDRERRRSQEQSPEHKGADKVESDVDENDSLSKHPEIPEGEVVENEHGLWRARKPVEDRKAPIAGPLRVTFSDALKDWVKMDAASGTYEVSIVQRELFRTKTTRKRPNGAVSVAERLARLRSPGDSESDAAAAAEGKAALADGASDRKANTHGRRSSRSRSPGRGGVAAKGPREEKRSRSPGGRRSPLARCKPPARGSSSPPSRRPASPHRSPLPRVAHFDKAAARSRSPPQRRAPPQNHGRRPNEGRNADHRNGVREETPHEVPDNRKDGEPSMNDEERSRAVRVRNFPAKTIWAKLCSQIRGNHRISGGKIDGSTNSAIVFYDDVDQARAAVKQFDGFNFVVHDGESIISMEMVDGSR